MDSSATAYWYDHDSDKVKVVIAPIDKPRLTSSRALASPYWYNYLTPRLFIANLSTCFKLDDIPSTALSVSINTMLDIMGLSTT